MDVVQNFGAVQDKVLNEGIHFKIPMVQTVILMDVKIQKAMTDAASSSSDLQDVDLSVALNYHIIPDKDSFRFFYLICSLPRRDANEVRNIKNSIVRIITLMRF